MSKEVTKRLKERPIGHSLSLTHKKRRYRPEGYKCPHPSCKDLPSFKTPQSLGGHVTRVHTTADLDAIITMKEAEKRKKKRR